MICKKARVLAVAILIGLIAQSVTAAGQKIKRCKVRTKVKNAPPYQTGMAYRTVPSKLLGTGIEAVVQIYIAPRYLNHDDLLRLALKLKQVYCEEEELFILLYDNPAYIKHIYITNDAWFNRAEDAKRGYYIRSRKTGEEYITYSTAPNYVKSLNARIRIDIGATSSEELNVPVPKPNKTNQ